MLLPLESKIALKKEGAESYFHNLRVDNQKMRNILKFFSEDASITRAPISKQALKFVEAARYGEIR